MTQDEIIEMAMKSGCPRENAFVNFDILQDFAKLVAAKEREAWQNAAIRVGENLATCGPAGYYDYTAQQWLDWALGATTKMQDDYMNLGACGEREACAQICEQFADADSGPEGIFIDYHAHLIRARGE